MKKIIITQFIVLLLGTAFAWFSFIKELLAWLNKSACTTGCAVGMVNPFLSSCFYGAIFFTTAFILSIIILKKSQK